MKNKIILSVLILSVITLLFSGCGGEVSVTPPIPDNGEISNYFRLDVPCIEQNFNNLCLPVSAAMILKYYKDPRDIAEIRDKLALPWQEDGTGGIMVLDNNNLVGDIDKLFDYVKSLGFNTKKEWDGLTIEEIKNKLKGGFPIIVLQDFYLDPNKKYDGHFSVIVGYREIGDNDEENKLIINDPWSSRGQYWEVTYSDFKIRNSNWWKENYNCNSDLSHSYIIWKDTSITNTYTITASAGSNGSISPSGDVTVNQGSDKSFTITPDTGYQIDDVLVDGSSVGAVSSYTFTNVTEAHTISATFISVAPGLVHNINKGTYYDTIQAALDDADNNNTIEVADGTYDESITFPSGKKIILQSVNGASLTVIRGDNYSSTVNLNNSSEGTTLKGFNITHADGLIGRGIYIADGNLSIKNCNIADNNFSSSCRGSGIDNEGILTIDESIINGNTTYGSGGGIDNYNGVLTITASTISSNSAGSGGGGINNGNGILTIDESIISGNFSNSAGSGGGIDNYNGTIIIIASTISGNSADIGGGGISNGTGAITITASTIFSNSAGSGGGIANVGTLNINTSAIHSNFASLLGGGVYNGSSLNITGSEIIDNFAYYHGGGICNYSEGTLIITESIISGNTTDDADAGGDGSVDIGGGGISNCGILTIVTSTISGNTTDDSGGGIETFNDGTLNITGSTISNNSANYGGGIDLYNSWGNIIIGGDSGSEKNTICGNYKTGEDLSLDQQIRGDSGSLYDTYKNTNYISVYCD